MKTLWQVINIRRNCIFDHINGTSSNLNSPEPRGADLSIQSNNDPQDEVLDYSKGSSGTGRILVPTYQTSIFSGEFRNTTELQNFERLLELRCAKRKGTFVIVLLVKCIYRIMLKIL